MGRKADPRGKDRPRSIVLAGDVAEIAQNLADKGILSSTLSDLLRFNYGFGDAIDEKKRELDATVGERLALQEKEEALAAAIDGLEADFLERQSTIKPNLLKRKDILLARLQKTEQKLSYTWDHAEENRLRAQMNNIHDLILEVNNELEELGC
jgi:hypothetical protein